MSSQTLCEFILFAKPKVMWHFGLCKENALALCKAKAAAQWELDEFCGQKLFIEYQLHLRLTNPNLSLWSRSEKWSRL